MTTTQQAHYTIVALYQDAEIAIGEGDSYEYAMRECLQGVPSIYPAEDVFLDCANSAMPWVRVSMPLEVVRDVFSVEA